MANTAMLQSTTVTPNQCINILKRVLTTDRVPFIWGPPGVAKSSIAKLHANSMPDGEGGIGIAFADVRLSQMDPTDLRGIPFPTVQNGVQGVRWSQPLVLPHEIKINEVVKIEYAESINFDFSYSNPKGANGIHYVKNPKIKAKAVGTNSAAAVIISQNETSAEIALFEVDEQGQPTNKMVPGAVRVQVEGEPRVLVALEEFNSAALSVQAASYELILDRRLGEYVVPQHVKMVAMGNRETDKGVTFRLASPAANRFNHYEMAVNFKEWQTWALNAMIHPHIVGYLSAFTSELFSFNPGTSGHAFATPRSWHALSDIMNHPDNKNINDEELAWIAIGNVGDAIGNKFVVFRKFMHTLPSSDSILSGRVTTVGELETQYAYAMTMNLTYELKNRVTEIQNKHGRDYKQTPEFAVFLEQGDRFMKFVTDNFRPEIAIIGARCAVHMHKLPFMTNKMKNFSNFVHLNKEFIIG